MNRYRLEEQSILSRLEKGQKVLAETLEKIEERLELLETSITTFDSLSSISTELMQCATAMLRKKSIDDIVELIQSETDSDKLKEIILKVLKTDKKE